jgi:hypothetical protein
VLSEQIPIEQCFRATEIPAKTVKRHIPPPPIKRPPGQFKDEEVAPAKKRRMIADVHSEVLFLRMEAARLKADNQRIDNCTGELYVRKNLEDKINALRSGLCSRIARIEAFVQRFLRTDP